MRPRAAGRSVAAAIGGLMSVAATGEDAVIARLSPVGGFAAGGKTQFQQFAHSRSPRRHAVLEAEVIDQSELFRGEQELKAVGAECVLHGVRLKEPRTSFKVPK